MKPTTPNGPLEIALATARPLPATHAEDCQACYRELAEDFNPPSRRKNADVNRVLDLLDSLERKGGTL